VETRPPGKLENAGQSRNWRRHAPVLNPMTRRVRFQIATLVALLVRFCLLVLPRHSEDTEGMSDVEPEAHPSSTTYTVQYTSTARCCARHRAHSGPQWPRAAAATRRRERHITGPTAQPSRPLTENQMYICTSWSVGRYMLLLLHLGAPDVPPPPAAPRPGHPQAPCRESSPAGRSSRPTSSQSSSTTGAPAAEAPPARDAVTATTMPDPANRP
jgi:hypothetical protein